MASGLSIYKYRFLVFFMVWASILELMCVIYFIATSQYRFEFYISLILLIITLLILTLLIVKMKKEIQNNIVKYK